MALPKLRSAEEIADAERSARHAGSIFEFAGFLILVHGICGSFAQVIILFAGGALRPSLCFELLGAFCSMLAYLFGQRIGKRISNHRTHWCDIVERGVAILVWFATVGLSICYALVREEWILALWAMLLLVTVWQLFVAELQLRTARDRIADATQRYEVELQQLMDRLTC